MKKNNKNLIKIQKKITIKSAKAWSYVLPSKKFEVEINGYAYASFFEGNAFLKMYFDEIFFYFDLKKILKKKIIVVLEGGGIFSRVVAGRISVCRALCSLFPKLNLFEKIKKERRDFLIPDSRKKYMKLPLRKGARAKYQLSFR